MVILYRSHTLLDIFCIKGEISISNPYNGILNIIKQQNNSSSSAVVIGKVINTNPLSISIGELFLDSEDLMVNENIKGFNMNDTLAMILTENRQKYIVFCKVVKP